jgi:putative intracellular protease/amidase
MSGSLRFNSVECAKRKVFVAMMLESLKSKARNALLNSNAGSAMHYFSRDVFCIKETSTTELNDTMYEPALCVVLQGEKQTNIASRALRIAAGDSVIISHHVPVHAQITQASISMPYLSLIIKLDPAILHSLHLEIDQISAKKPLAYAVDVEKTESALLETIDRYLSILADPIEAELIGPATFKELHLRVLRAPHGAMLRQMIPGNSGYQAIFFAGGHGTMWDFPDSPAVQRVTREIYERGGVVAAVCHGPAALVNVKLSNGDYLLKGKRFAAFTDDEERAVKLESVVPFLLASTMQARGGTHEAAANFQAKVVSDQRLVTGQNPASATGVAEAVAMQLTTTAK